MVLGIIPALGGSKGLPGKKIKALCGKPLIVRSIEQTKKSKYIDRSILPSEDDETIKGERDRGLTDDVHRFIFV
jgi:CMP-N,N'-diacetyllegionaminic acid synthase